MAVTLIATPYVFAYDDRAAIAISDRLPRKRQILLALFGTVFAVLVTFADRPVGSTFEACGPVVMITVLGVVLR